MLSDHERRPCHAAGKNPPPCALAHYRRVIDNHAALHGPWSGWRLARLQPKVIPAREQFIGYA